MKNIIYTLAGLLLLAACEPEFGEEPIFNGRWLTKNVTTEHYHLGVLKKTEIDINVGFMELIDSSWAGEEINQMWLDSSLAYLIIPFHRLDSMGILEQVGLDVYGTYWKADPAKYRFYITAFNGALSSTEVVNLTMQGNNMTWVCYESKGEEPYTLTTKQTIEFTRQ